MPSNLNNSIFQEANGATAFLLNPLNPIKKLIYSDSATDIMMLGKVETALEESAEAMTDFKTAMETLSKTKDHQLFSEEHLMNDVACTNSKAVPRGGDVGCPSQKSIRSEEKAASSTPSM